MSKRTRMILFGSAAAMCAAAAILCAVSGYETVAIVEVILALSNIVCILIIS